MRHDTVSKVIAQGKPLADFQVMTELEQGDLRLAASGKGDEYQCYKTAVICSDTQLDLGYTVKSFMNILENICVNLTLSSEQL